MGISSQLNFLPALRSGKNMVTTGHEAAWATEPVGASVEAQKNLLLLPG